MVSEIKLFEIGTVVKERTSSTVLLEKQLQTTIEQNMETFFGVRFLKSEYAITSGRMDSIGIDENNSPVIFEYKRSTSENVINQGLFYLDWLLDHKVIAFKQYAKKYKLNFGFVRDINEELFINNTEYHEDMSHDSWRPLEELL